MFLFEKKEHREVELKFNAFASDNDIKVNCFFIEPHGLIDGVETYFYSYYAYNGYDDEPNEKNEILDKLRSLNGKAIKVTLIYKNNKLKDFKLNLNDLNIPETKYFELIGTGINSFSCEN